MSSTKVNLQHFILNAVALTAERTLIRDEGLPTLTIELREALKGSTKFNNDTKFSVQLNPDTELYEFAAVCLTHRQKCDFSYHGDDKNKSLICEWDLRSGALKMTIFKAGTPRFIMLPRSKVTQLALLAVGQIVVAMNNSGIYPLPVEINSVINILARTYRHFKTSPQINAAP